VNVPAVVILLGLLVFLAHALEDFFARTKVPDVLILLGLGLLLGPFSGLVHPEDLGAAGPVFTTLTLVVILFEGGLGLDLKVLGRSLGGATGLTVWSFVATMLVVTPIVRFMMGFTWLQAATLASILGGTSSAVVIPLVSRLALGERAKAILSLESALSDVLVIVVALALMGAQSKGELKVGALFGGMVAAFALAAVLGALAGVAWSLALNRLRGLQNSIFTTPAFVIVVYGLVELLGYSGAIAALALGITLGNIDALPLAFLRRTPETLASLTSTEREVFREVVFLLKTFFFVYVGISIQLSSLPLALTGLLLTAALFAVRVPVVHASLGSGHCNRFEACVAGAMTPKGLAAAVVASVPLQMGLERGLEVKLTVFAVVLFSILLASILVFLVEQGWFRPLARLLYARYGEPSPDPQVPCEP